MNMKLENICKSYLIENHKERQILKNVNLLIDSPGLYFIVGPSGSGKTTLLNIMGLMDSPTSGEMYIDKKPVSNQSDYQLALVRKEQIGFIYQSFNLIDYYTVLDNVLLSFYVDQSFRKKEKKALALLNQLGIQSMAEQYPRKMSGGEKQRVAITRALLKEPQFILADEPTGELDSKNTEKMIDILRELSFEKKIPIVIVTHDLSIIRKDKDILFLIKDGQLIRDN